MEYKFIDFFRDINHYVKPYRGKFALAFFLRFTSDLAQLYPAFALSRLIYLLTLKNTDNLSSPIIQLFLIWIFLQTYKSIARESAKYLGFQVAERAGLDLYRDVLKHIFTLDLAWHEVENSGNKFKRISTEILTETIRRVWSVTTTKSFKAVKIETSFCSCILI